MTCYTNALNSLSGDDEELDGPAARRVQKCLQKLLRALHKDRHHTIQHYRHILDTSLEQAERERDITVEHLADIDRLVTESLEMLKRFDALNARVMPLMEDYLVALRSRDNTPASLLRMDKEHEKEMIDGYTNDIRRKIKEREEERMEEKRNRLFERKQTEGTLGTTKDIFAGTTATQEAVTTKMPSEKSKKNSLKIEVHATATHHHKQLDPVVAHAQSHDFSHSQSGYSVRRVEMGDNNSVYMTLAFAGVAMMAAMVVGIVVIRRRNGRHPHHQLVSVQTTRSARGFSKKGFVEVDQTASPEEKHVASMQMNGYENPTYKYFEASA